MKTAVAVSSIRRRILVAGFVLPGVSVLTVLGNQTASERPLAFDVSSVKLHPVSANAIDVVRRSRHPSLPSEPKRRFSDHMTTVKVLILRAYALNTYQVVGLPGWAGNEGARDVEYYDVDAVAPMENPTRPQLQVMLQSLLAERFQLRAHRETRELSVYALMIAKGGPKFKAITGEPTPISPTLYTLTQSLSRHVDRPILDRTDLTGYYDFPPIFRELAQERPGSASGISGLLRGSLGLELKPERANIEVLVVDHVQRPSPN